MTHSKYIFFYSTAPTALFLIFRLHSPSLDTVAQLLLPEHYYQQQQLSLSRRLCLLSRRVACGTTLPSPRFQPYSPLSRHSGNITKSCTAFMTMMTASVSAFDDVAAAAILGASLTVSLALFHCLSLSLSLSHSLALSLCSAGLQHLSRAYIFTALRKLC